MISMNMLTILFLAAAIAILASAIVWALLDAREPTKTKRLSSVRRAKSRKQASGVQGGSGGRGSRTPRPQPPGA